MAITSRSVEYEYDGKTFEGRLVRNSEISQPAPAVLVSHAWGGRTDMETRYAERVAGRRIW